MLRKNPATLDFVCVRGSGFSWRMVKIQPFGSIRTDSVPQTITSKLSVVGTLHPTTEN
ncbi:hypothetical protein [Virgibacillus kimchii]